MKIIAGASLAVLLLAGPAFAQSPPSASDGPPRDDRMMAAQPHFPGPMQPQPPGPVKSARFRLQVGRIFLGLTCPDDEPMKACQDFAMQLLDKAEAMQKH